MRKIFLLTVFALMAIALAFSVPVFAQNHPYDVATCGTCHGNGMKSEKLDCGLCHDPDRLKWAAEKGSENAPVWMPDIAETYKFVPEYCNGCHTGGFHPGMQNQKDAYSLDCVVCHGPGTKADVVVIHAAAHADFARLPYDQQVEGHSSCFNPYYGKNPNKPLPCHGGL